MQPGVPQRCPKRSEWKGINNEPRQPCGWRGSLFYKLSKRNESKVRRLLAPELYEGEIVVYQLSEIKYKGKMWRKYDQNIKEMGKI